MSITYLEKIKAGIKNTKITRKLLSQECPFKRGKEEIFTLKRYCEFFGYIPEDLIRVGQRGFDCYLTEWRRLKDLFVINYDSVTLDLEYKDAYVTLFKTAIRKELHLASLAYKEQ